MVDYPCRSQQGNVEGAAVQLGVGTAINHQSTGPGCAELQVEAISESIFLIIFTISFRSRALMELLKF